MSPVCEHAYIIYEEILINFSLILPPPFPASSHPMVWLETFSLHIFHNPLSLSLIRVKFSMNEHGLDNGGVMMSEQK